MGARARLLAALAEAPTVAGAAVTGEVVKHGKDKKVIIFKWKRRKNYRRKQGHRQDFTEVRIGDIKLEQD